MTLSNNFKVLLFILPVFIAVSALTPAALKKMPDRDITTAIETEMLVNDTVSSHLIDVETEDGLVTLSGTVDSLLEKDRAEKIAESIKGVRSVVNLLETEPVERSDKKIADDVELALLEDPATESFEIDVEANGGEVILGGTVNSYWEKELVEFTAKGVEGIRAIENELSIEYIEDRPDHEIKADIEGKLESDVRIDDEFITVVVDNGVAELSGTVGSAYEKSRARLDTWVTGVKDVISGDLKVRSWARDRMMKKKDRKLVSDGTIRKYIRDAYFRDPRIDAFNPDINVENDAVTLKGRVESLESKRAAADVARNTVGVWVVRNHLKVRPEERPGDHKLEEKLEAAIARNPDLELSNIEVDVVNGRAVLNGRVESYFKKNRAEDAVSRVSGIVDADNNLIVSDEWERKADWIIRDDVQSQLFWSPFVDEERINVKVEMGTVTLTGKADDWYERRKAVENAWEGGARDVINRIKIMQ